MDSLFFCVWRLSELSYFTLATLQVGFAFQTLQEVGSYLEVHAFYAHLPIGHLVGIVLQFLGLVIFKTDGEGEDADAIEFYVVAHRKHGDKNIGDVLQYSLGGAGSDAEVVALHLFHDVVGVHRSVGYHLGVNGSFARIAKVVHFLQFVISHSLLLFLGDTFLFLILVIGSVCHWRTFIRCWRISVRLCRMCIRHWRIEPFRLQRYKIKGRNARIVRELESRKLGQGRMIIADEDGCGS